MEGERAMPIRPQLQKILDDAQDIRGKANTKLRKLTPNQLMWSPTAEKWPIAVVLDHLNKCHTLTIPRFEEALKEAKQAGEERDVVIPHRFMDRVFLKLFGGSAPIQIPVPPMFEPDPKPNPKQAVSQFFALHDEFEKVVKKSDDYQLTKLRVISPVTERVKVSYITYLEIQVLHEAYHWQQMDWLTKQIDFPKK